MQFWKSIVILAVAAAIGLAQPKPITKPGLLDALRIGGLEPAELVGFVKQRGVDFAMSAQDEADLRKAGAQTPLIEAVRTSYRGAPAAAPKASPKTAPNAPRTPMVAPRTSERAPGPTAKSRVPPQAPTPPPAKPAPEAPTPGQPPPAQVPPTAPNIAESAPPPSPPAPSPKKQAPAARPAAKASVNSLAEVRRIFIEQMPEDLDDYLRAEIHKQLKGRLEVVLQESQADAIMTGVGEEKTGTGAVITGRYLGLHDNATGAVSIVDRNRVKILWSDEAGDRSLLLGAFKRGGARKVAGRLIGKLKKVL